MAHTYFDVWFGYVKFSNSIPQGYSPACRAIQILKMRDLCFNGSIIGIS